MLKTLMLGWEFPPFISGGLGTACYGLTRAMSQFGTKIIFLLPRPVSSELSSHVKFAAVRSKQRRDERAVFKLDKIKNITFRTIRSALQPYQDAESYTETVQASCRAIETTQNKKNGHKDTPCKPTSFRHYGDNLYHEVQRYAKLARQIGLEEDFDIIHAHDWMTYPAGIAVAEATGKPLVVHIHSTEFDRSGEHVNQMIYDIERQGFVYADNVIAVSCLTRDILINRYEISEDKISVVYNAIEHDGGFVHIPPVSKKLEKTVLFWPDPRKVYHCKLESIR